MRVRHTASAIPALLPLIAALGVALTACDADTSSESALQEAEATLAAMHTGTTAAPGEFVTTTHNDIRRTLAPALSDSRESIQAAAKLLEGQTFAGDAAVAARAATEHEVTAGDLLSEAQMLAGRLYVWRHARADAAASYSPDQSVREIDAAIADAQTERTALIQERDTVQTRLDDLTTAVAEGSRETSQLRTREVQLRDESLDLEGDQRLATIEQVYAAQRAADASVASTSDLEARIENLRPEFNAIEHQIAGTDRLIELLRATKEALLERGARSARTVQTDRQEASTVANRLEALLTDLEEFRSTELEDSYQSAANAYRQAATSLRTAGSGGASPLWLASVQHSQAELATARAASNTRYADFLEAIAAVEPRLPFAAELTSRASAAREAAATHDQDAASNYAAAASTYRRAARGPQAGKLRALADQLDARATGDEPDPADITEG